MKYDLDMDVDLVIADTGKGGRCPGPGGHGYAGPGAGGKGQIVPGVHANVQRPVSHAWGWRGLLRAYVSRGQLGRAV